MSATRLATKQPFDLQQELNRESMKMLKRKPNLAMSPESLRDISHLPESNESAVYTAYPEPLQNPTFCVSLWEHHRKAIPKQLIPVSISGYIVELNVRNRTFVLETNTEEQISGNYPLPLEKNFLTALSDKYSKNVQISGSASCTISGKPESFIEVKEIRLLENTRLEVLDIDKQLEELANLEEGWLDGEGEKIERENINWVASIIKQLKGIETPRLYPRLEGNVQAEWTFGDWEVTLRLEFEERLLAVRAVNLHENEVPRKYLKDTSEEIDLLRSFLERFHK